MSVETNAVVTLPVDLFVCRICVCVLMCVCVCACFVCVHDYVLVMYICVLVSQGLFLLLLALGGAICDVVEAGSDARQVEQRPRRLLHLLVVALRRLLHSRRAPLLQRQRVANAPRSVFGPGQTAPCQSPSARPRTTSLSAQGLLGNVGGCGGSTDVRIQRDLPGLGFDV